MEPIQKQKKRAVKAYEKVRARENEARAELARVRGRRGSDEVSLPERDPAGTEERPDYHERLGEGHRIHVSQGQTLPAQKNC